VFEIGNSLREARLRQGYELPRVEADTKIRAKYLRALEEERFEVLPGETYVKGFLRTYSEYLGLDGHLYVDEFNSRFTRERSRSPRRARAARQPERAPWSPTSSSSPSPGSSP
jgi:cytoskeletal protein RodZ